MSSTRSRVVALLAASAVILLGGPRVREARAECAPEETYCFEGPDFQLEFDWTPGEKGKVKIKLERSPGSDEAAHKLGLLVYTKGLASVAVTVSDAAGMGLDIASELALSVSAPSDTTVPIHERPSEYLLAHDTSGTDRDGQEVSGGGQSPAANPRGSSESKETGADPINPANGELIVSEVDLSFPGFGLPFEHIRSYRSRVAFHGTLGYGWDHSYNRRLIPFDPEECVGQLVYSTGALGSIRFEPFEGGYRSPPGVDATLHAVGVLSPEGWVLRHPGGIDEQFDTRGLLTRIEDRNGQGISFEWEPSSTEAEWRLSRAVDSVGRTIVYEYDSEGLLTRVAELDTGLAVGYEQDGNGDLVRVTDVNGSSERYEYSFNPLFEGMDFDGQVPEGELRAACQLACAPSETSCIAGGACDIASEWHEDCLDYCAGCADECATECNGACADACRPGCDDACRAECASLDAIGTIDAECDVIWDEEFRGYCEGCDTRCAAACGEKCDALLVCVDGESGAGCLAEYGVEVIVAAVELITTGFAALIDGLGCLICSIPGTPCDPDCSFSNARDYLWSYCNKNCTNCCANGESCAAGSCNEGHECEDDCAATFFGDDLAPPVGPTDDETVMACPSTGLSCSTIVRAACERNCGKDCLSTCRGTCTPECTASCVAECPAGDCNDYCDAQDFPQQCLDLCVPDCMVAQHETQGGVLYGKMPDLNHNLVRAYDGNGALYLENTYGDDVHDASFDAVIHQSFGGWELELAYRDLASEARGEITAPAAGELGAEATPRESFATVDICPADGSEAVRAAGEAAPDKLKPERATIARDAFGARWVYYYDGFVRRIRSENKDAGSSWSWSYDDNGRATGVEAPLGGRSCVTYDAIGNVTEYVELPEPGALGTTVPIVHRFSYRYDPVRLETMWDPRDPDRALATYAYDGAGNLVSATDGVGEITTFTPTAMGVPSSIEGPDGAVTAIEYDLDVGLPASVTLDATGPEPWVETSEYDRAGRPLTRTNPIGFTTEWVWSAARLVSMTQYAGTADEKAAFAYDADGQLIYTTDGVLETWHAYHPTGHLRTTRIHAADGSVPDAIECRSVGPDGRLLERVLPEGNRVRYDYDARGLPASAVAGAWAPSSESWDDDCLPAFVGTPALGALGTVDYDQNGRPVRQVDGRFAITALEYDGFGRLARVIDPDGAVAQTGYDELGNPTWANVYEPGTAAAYSPATWTTAGLLGAEQQYYDGAGVLEQRDVWHFETPGLPIGDGLSSTTFGRDVAGRKRFAVDDFGHTTTVELDGLGRVRRVLLPTGDSIATDYDLAARAVTQTQTAPTADGSVSMTTYLTEWGAPSRVETNDLALPVVVASRFYDDRGRLQAETGASGAKATYELDALGRVASSVQDFGSGPLATLVLQRNRNGDVVRRDHDSGFEIATSIYKHDALGRVVLAIDPDGGTRSLRYEHATSLPSRITDARGITQHIAYTDTGRVSDVWASGGTELAHRSFEYDGRGRILAAIDDGRGSSAADDVITSFAWDSLGNQILEKNNIVGYAVQHRFDAGGRAIESTLGTLPVARNFDALGRTLDVFLEGDATPAAHFTYAGLGGPTSRYYDNSAATRFYYDDLGRLEGVADTRGGKLLADWDWQLPLDGVPRTATLRRAGFDAAASVFDLDREGRVELEAHDAPFAGGVELDPGASWEDAAAAVAGAAKGAADWRSYVLDARHNWRRRDAADPSLATSPSINTMDAYTTFAGASATYNAIGSLEWHGSDRYRYDDFGQLRYARRNGKWFEYRYDALGRIVEEIPHSSGEEPTRFSYDGDRRTLRLDSGVLHAMVSGDGLDEHLVEVAADGLRHYYHQDRQGSVYLITDRFGKPAEWYSYTAYGEVGIESPGGASLASSAIGNRFGFQGHLFNDTTGLVQMRARFYLPEWGRFINRDPIGLAGGSNRYAFVGSAPLAWTDPLGLAKKRLAREWQRQRMRWRVNRDVYSGNFKWAADEQVQLLEEWFTFESAGGTMEEYQEIVGDYLLQRARTYWDRAGTSKHLGPRDGTKPLERELRLNNANDANPVDWIGSSYFAYAKTTYLHDYMAAISVGISGAALTHSFYTGQFSSGFRASSTLPVGSRIPTTARDVLAHVRQHGAPPPGVRGGRVFRNDGRGGSQVLSRTDRNGNAIRYREWDVNPYQRGVNRGPERIVTGSDGRAYYTADHYRTFTEIQ